MANRWIRVTLFGLVLIVGAAAFALFLWKSPFVGEIPEVKVEPLTFTPTDPCTRVKDSDFAVLFIPPAMYTAAARRQNVAGTVKVFGYLMDNGKIDVERVISPLSHGLSDEAVKATRLIKFKPATTCGHPMVEPAEVHYDFPSGQGRVIRF